MVRIVGVLVSLLVVVCVGCAPEVPEPETLTPITVQLAWTHQAQFAGLYAADQLGLFKEEGLGVTFLEGGANYDKFAPVLDGRAQFGVGGADELILARSQGKALKAVATIYRLNPVVFVSLKDKNITRPQDFAGKTIRGSANVEPTLHAMMAYLGIQREQYTVIETPSDAAMFASGEIPVWGAFRNGFAVTLEQAGYEMNYIYPDDYGVHFYADSLFTADEEVKARPDVVLRFTRAALKGWTYAVENPDKIAAMVQKYNPKADLEVESSRMLATIPLVNTGEDYIGWMNAQTWSEMEKALREQGVISEPVDVAQVYTLLFLQDIYR